MKDSSHVGHGINNTDIIARNADIYKGCVNEACNAAVGKVVFICNLAQAQTLGFGAFPFRMKSSLSSSMRENMSHMYSQPRRLKSWNRVSVSKRAL